ncbi:MAG: HRDC domain-containing protein [Phycisphaerae bacterium]|nr:HRDC domain-containing protein [Phycisphaerae bacterium]
MSKVICGIDAAGAMYYDGIRRCLDGWAHGRRDIVALGMSLHDDFVYIDTASKPASLIERMATADRIAVDVEADSFHHYYEKVCLIQVAVNGGVYLVDPLAGLDLSQFAQVLGGRVLIFHDGGYDLRMLRQSLAFEPQRGVFDTMLAAQLLGYREFGLSALLKRFFDVNMVKTHQKANWSRRPLDKNLLSYAGEDVRYLHKLADMLEAELRALGRLAWHEESCREMVRAAQVDKGPPDEERQWRIKGTRLLSRRQLACVRRLWYWREREAQEADLPPFKIIGNIQLIELALWAERHPDTPLTRGPRLPRHFVNSRLERLAAAIAEAGRLPESAWPKPLPCSPKPPTSEAFRRTVEILKDQCRQKAEALGIEPFVLAPRAMLTSIVQHKPCDVGALVAASGAMHWQAEVIWPIVQRVVCS